MTIWTFEIGTAWLATAAFLSLIAAVIASGHAVLYKRDDRGTTMWLGLIWTLPLLGPGLYLGFGINRIKRRAVSLRRNAARPEWANEHGAARERVMDVAPAARHLSPLVGIVGKLTDVPLLGGNEIEPLFNAENAYPAMIEAIAAARHTVSLSTYIFDRDEVGLAVADALGAAVGHGVQVRVLIDATGTLFTRHSITRTLRERGVPFARFLPALSLGKPVSLNLRNHRKLLVVDGKVGFTGGMNICEGRLRARKAVIAVEDVQFRVRGPVVAHLQKTFADDWRFATGETLGDATWFPPLAPVGEMWARGIADGPDEEFERTKWAILNAVSLARTSLRILTPYFLPDAVLISSLNLAAMRGVSVEIVLPTEGDVPFVQWASAAHWWQLLQHDCRIWVAPAPFDHSKLLIVDDVWVLLGSTNWDPRSLRLNFEFNLECYDPPLAARLAVRFEERKQRARQVTLDDANARSLGIRLRDGIARLLSPFM